MSERGFSGAADSRGRPVTAEPPLTVLRGRGPRSARLDAIAIVRSQADAETTTELRRVALDPDDDAVVRAAAIRVLAERGEAVTTESQPPASVQMAQKKAADVLRTRRLVGSFERGAGAERLPGATLLDAPAAGLTIQTATPDAQVQAQVSATASLQPIPGGPGTLQVLLLRCGPNELAIVADPGRLNSDALLKRPARPAQIAVHHTLERDVWTVPFEVVTEPASNGIRITVLDARGLTRFAGTGQAAGPQSIAFTLQATDEPGATPVILEGRIDNGTVKITAGRSDHGASPPRRPQRVSGPI